MATIKKILLKKSNVVSNRQPKLPTASDLDYGEIAINYAQGYETISLKNSANQIATLQNEVYVGSVTNAVNTTAKFCIDTTQTPNVLYVRSNSNTFNVINNSLNVTPSAISSVPTSSDIVVVTTSSDGSLTLSGSTIPQGKELHIIVKNSSTTKDITITIPTNTFKNSNVDNITIPSSSFGEINILSTSTSTDGYYLRAID